MRSKPQSMPSSPSSWTRFEQVEGAVHAPDEQLPLAQSKLNWHVLPTAHFGQKPPQSTSASTLLKTPSVRFAALMVKLSK